MKRVTLELSEEYIKLLKAKCELSGINKHIPLTRAQAMAIKAEKGMSDEEFDEWIEERVGPELDAGGILGLCVLLAVSDVSEVQASFAIPMMWRGQCEPVLEEDTP